MSKTRPGNILQDDTVERRILHFIEISVGKNLRRLGPERLSPEPPKRSTHHQHGISAVARAFVTTRKLV